MSGICSEIAPILGHGVRLSVSHNMYVAFSQRLCSALLLRGDTAIAIRLLTKQSAINELDEETIKLLMRAHSIQKNKEALVQQYIKFVDMLHHEMGVSPSLEVTILYERLLRELNTYWKQHDGKDI